LALHELLQPDGGLFGALLKVRADCSEPRLDTRIARLGDVGQAWAHVWRGADGRPRADMNGSASGIDDDDCQRRALAEGLERYCASVFGGEQFVRASAKELGREALDLDAIPRCSENELRHPRCPLVAPDKDAPIRWVRGLSLRDGRDVFVPAVMVYLYAGFSDRSERICLPITTGCAAHVSYERALVPAILEVIERDAISIVWLQKLALPRIEIDDAPPLLAANWERYQRSSSELEYFFFDATTDLGFPTVYALQRARCDERVATLVACSTELTATAAVAKTMRDMASSRVTFRHARPCPESWDDFTEISHGSTYMARAERSPAFDFLVGSARVRRLSEMRSQPAEGDRQRLRAVLQRLEQAGLEAYAVDISTDEALRAGMRVVRVLIPGLQPLSFWYRARYLGHPRLYSAPQSMGYRALPESQLNHWPQPFD
jgi:ribosomal protein S12 methylthiotransferase accessory factor